jgi:hypothetical protein
MMVIHVVVAFRWLRGDPSDKFGDRHQLLSKPARSEMPGFSEARYFSAGLER